MSPVARAPQPPADGTATAGRVLVVDDHARARESMTDVLRHAGHTVAGCASAVEALRLLEKKDFDVIVTDLMMPGMNGLDFIRALRQRHCAAKILMVTAHASVSSAVEAMRYGAFDYIEKPFEVDQLEQLVARALRQSLAADPHTTVPPSGGSRAPVTMIGNSHCMQLLRQRVAQVAPTRETVLITGESGTGKELVARGIHAASDRAGAIMVGLNCPALSDQLMESELFGHERGAFTSADAPRIGRFELADGGTLLLDEITEIPLPLQAKLLRVLQEKCFERVGSSTTCRVDVRILATTNRDLRHEVHAGRFREDLYYRVAVVPLHVPPLRERPEDIPALADYFLGQAAARLGTRPDNSTRRRRTCWPTITGPATYANWRILSRGPASSAPRLPSGRPTAPVADRRRGGPVRPSRPNSVPVGLSLETMERKLIESTLEHYSGHRAKTAQALGIGVRTLCNKLRSYGYAPRAQRPSLKESFSHVRPVAQHDDNFHSRAGRQLYRNASFHPGGKRRQSGHARLSRARPFGRDLSATAARGHRGRPPPALAGG